MSRKYGKIKNPALKQQWLTDLRSGNLNQCQKQLCEVGTKNVKASYCCLGVLGRSIQKIAALPIKFSGGTIEYNGEQDRAELPTNLRKEIGLTEAGMVHLIEMNDDGEKDFKEIADFIEKRL